MNNDKQAPHPGEGYRILTTGERLSDTDEFWDNYKNQWIETSRPGLNAWENDTYRRRIALGEVQCRYCGEWIKAVDGCGKCKTLPPAQPLFEKRALASIARVTATFGQRGNEYGDTMRDCQWLALRAAAKQLGIDIPLEKARAIAIAGMVDIKYQRLQGGYKDDSVIDGVAYATFLADEMQELAGGAK